MASTFGWLDTDESQRKKVLEIVQLFKDEGTVDELGVGSVRDTIANALFPGTSVLHTRLRYALFIPWLLQRSAVEHGAEQMSRAMRQHEIALIHALLKTRQRGVIGKQAKERLKRMPSAAYWAQLAAWDVRTSHEGGHVSVSGFFRHAHAVKALNSRTVPADDLEARDQPERLLLDPNLPPPPPQLLESATFDLTPEEEEYLSTKITVSTDGSLLSWLVTHPPAHATTDYIWDLDDVDVRAFPAQSQRLVEHGRRFHSAIFGATLLYNLMLSEKAKWDEGVEDYTKELGAWRGEMEDAQAMLGWDRVDFWATLVQENRRLSPVTKHFVDGWLDLLEEATDVSKDHAARSLVERRERQIKGGRARLVNAAALDNWSGSSGLVRLDYRWHIARDLLNDLYTTRGLKRAA
jgi:hypothetical protein